MDIDSVLNLEKECYNRGKVDGLEAGEKVGHTEGRELGIQTGFLRYLPLGVLQSRTEYWQANNQGSSQSISKLQELIGIDRTDNDPEVVDKLERNTKLAKNKARIIASQTKSPPVVTHDKKITYQKDDLSEIEDI